MDNLEELIKLQKELKKLLKAVNKKNKKQLIIKNKKVFVTTIKHISPVIISTGIVSSVVYLFGYGKPFVLDNFKYNRVDTLEYVSPDYYSHDFRYTANNLFGEPVVESNVTIYTPYIFDGENYTRLKKDFIVNKIPFDEIKEHLVNNDIDYLINNLELKSSVEEKTNMLPDNFENTYYIEASLNIKDKENCIYNKEKTKSNIIFTSVDLILGIWIAMIVVGEKKRTLVDDLDDIYSLYNSKIIKDEELKKRIESIDKKIKVLKGANSYEK